MYLSLKFIQDYGTDKNYINLLENIYLSNLQSKPINVVILLNKSLIFNIILKQIQSLNYVSDYSNQNYYFSHL